jgi:ABC-2 type transport system permease protein
MLFLGQITNEPLGPLATVLGIVPLSAPIAMSMRVATAPIPAAQIAGTIGLLVVTVALMAWLAGKIYRIGILSTGRRPSMRELARWLRQA